MSDWQQVIISSGSVKSLPEQNDDPDIWRKYTSPGLTLSVRKMAYNVKLCGKALLLKVSMTCTWLFPQFPPSQNGVNTSPPSAVYMRQSGQNWFR